MYSLMALKNLIYISHNLADTYELSTGLQTAKRDDFSLVRSKSFASIAELRLVKAVLEQRKRKEDIADATIQEHSNAEMVKLRFRNLTKVSHMREIHEMLSEEQLLYFGRIRESHAAKYQHLTAQLSAYEKEKLRSEGSALSDQFSDEVAQLRVALNATMAALTFRAAEELRVAMQLQKLEEEQLLGTQSELLQAEVEEVINAFFAELYQWVQMVADHPGAALTVCKLLLAGFGVLLLALELRQVCLAVMEKLTGASYLPKVVRLAKSSDGGCRDLQWSSAVQVQVCKVVQAIAGAACNGLVLPNVLILGASGTGKSALIKRIVADVAAAAAATAPSVEMQLLSVCGADLLALGDAEAALFLNDLIRKQSHSGRLVLVVDDADCIIAGRNPPQHSPLPSTGPHEEGERADNCHKQQSTSICLFSLLAGLRVNSPHILLVLAARLDVSQVDCALLDRLVECCMCFCK